MNRYIIRRIVQTIPTLFLVSLVIFGIMHALPSDPVQLALTGGEGGAITPERLHELRETLGLNDPLYEQYFRFITRAMTGNLGTSIRLNQPVRDLVAERMGYTVQLALLGLSISISLGLLFGTISALKQNTWIDLLTTIISYIGISMPMFWLGLILIFFFAFTLGWFPSSGGTDFRSLILPGFALGFSASGMVTRLTRASLVEILNEDYIRTARSKGLKEKVVIIRHALRNALIPVITVVGVQFGYSLGGTVVIETVFSRQGIGRLLITGILWKDFPLVEGTVLIIAIIYIFVNLCVDISYSYIDPRIRLE